MSWLLLEYSVASQRFCTLLPQISRGSQVSICTIAAYSTMADIPIVDFSAYSGPESQQDKTVIAKQIDQAFKSRALSTSKTMVYQKSG